MGRWDLSTLLEHKKNQKVQLEERKVKHLITEMLKTPTIEKLVSPKSNEYMLIDKQNQMSVCLEHSGVKIANHSYLLNIPTTLKFAESLRDMVGATLEVERQQYKKILFKNQIDLMDNLINYYKEE